MSDFRIRKAAPGDLQTIVRYNQCLASETEGRRLDETTLTAGVQRVLEDPSKGQYFVAEVDGQVVGQMMYTREWSDWRNGDLLWLQSVYVHADHRGQGVFGRLLRQLQDIAESNPDVAGLRLYVENDNTTAQGTYVKHGFDMPGYIVMERLSSTVSHLA
jgi:ribosomal protein S18 acetylase RimI-like enzyme